MADEHDPFRKVRDELQEMDLPEGASEQEVAKRFEEKLRSVMAEAENANDAELAAIEHKLLAVEEEFEAVKESRRGHDALFDDEFEQRLSEFHGRVDTLKEAREAKESVVARDRSREKESARGLGVGLTVAYTIIGMPLVGAGLGWLLDRAFGTQIFVGIGVVALGAFGMVFAIVVLSRNNSS
ncbi:MAG TPA: hypothetical protein VK934_10055 [Fimbriimonas sp.]|nr:hypothetical protein [Fimbriimonas sp.]